MKNVNRAMKRFMRSRFRLVITVSALSFFAVSLFFFTTRTMERNVEDRAKEGLRQVVLNQAHEVDDLIEEHLQPLRLLAEMIDSADDFCDLEYSQLLQSVCRVHGYITLGYAEKGGNTVLFAGNSIDDITNKQFFTDVISEKDASGIEYLLPEEGGTAAQLVFSIPVSRNGKAEGILFAGKDLSAIRESVSSNVILGDIEQLILVKQSSEIVLSAENKQTEENDSALPDVYIAQELENLRSNVLEQDLRQGKSGCIIQTQNGRAVYSWGECILADILRENW